jgi:hypothetical protein
LNDFHLHWFKRSKWRGNATQSRMLTLASFKARPISNLANTSFDRRHCTLWGEAVGMGYPLSRDDPATGIDSIQMREETKVAPSRISTLR